MKSYLHMPVPSFDGGPAGRGGGHSGEPTWVLIIDDDRMAGRALARWVSHVTGLSVRVARTVHQAECWLQVMSRPLAVVTDFDLAGETGLDALRCLRDRGVRCPAIVVTGSPEAARAAITEAELGVHVPVLSKREAHQPLAAWLRELHFSWAASA